MADTRIKISSIVENQLPSFIREEYPLFGEFLKQYYVSLENQGGIYDILQNIDQYIKIDNLTNLIDSTETTFFVDFTDTTIVVKSTVGFPDSYGLIQIDNEIITYTSKTDTSFLNCVRGFSGIASYQNPISPDTLVFSESEINQHNSGSTVNNLSILFLKQFFKKVKTQIVPGFEDRQLHPKLNKNLFIKQSKDFYSSKGTDESFEILFRALYGVDVELIKPRDYLFIPSNAQYRITRDLVVEPLEGNPFDLLNKTLYQDETNNFQKSYGSVNNVKKIQRDGKDYYVISLDYDYDKDISVNGSIFGSFSIHPKTKLITSVSGGSSVLDVDSTVGFPTKGSIIADLNNGTSVNISYKSKSLTQFFECSGINQSLLEGQELRIDDYVYGYSGITTNNIVKVRIGGVLSDLNINSDTRYFSENDLIQIRTLGLDSNSVLTNSWIFNVATSYDVKSISLIDSSNFSYNITTFDKNGIVIGDTVRLLSTDETFITCVVFGVSNFNSFLVKGVGEIETTKKYKVQKILSKFNSKNYPESNIYTTNVQNVYTDYLDVCYVSSPSLPTYFNQALTINDKSITFSGKFDGEEINIGNHGFYTGDVVVYKNGISGSLNLFETLYYVKRISSTVIKLSRSKSNLYNSNYLKVVGDVVGAKIELKDFSNQKLESQKLIRNISNSSNSKLEKSTNPGPIGILVNGVEILNYKSKDSIFYGPIENIDVISPGENYDVINPPILNISDDVGVGATGYCEVEGNLSRIDIIDGGFNYITEPIITITGGNGKDAKAKAYLGSFEHSSSFNSIESSGLVNLSNNTIGFSSYHKFDDGEKVIYKSDGQQQVGGLISESIYYLSVQDSYNVKIHNNYDESISGINTVNLTSYGVGTQRFVSVNEKKKITFINIIDSGFGYKNRKIVVPSSGINTSFNTISAIDHKYSNGDVILYKTTGVPIGNLNDNTLYYVTKIDNNNFKLSQLGTSESGKDFYFKTKQYVNFVNSGSGNHIFNHQPISISVSGVVGISTRIQQNFNAILQPVFRGEIKSVFLENGGFNYGSEEIINFNKQPSFELKSGRGAQVKPIISNGKISEIIVLDSGSGYNSIPDLQISGPGLGEILTPIVNQGSLSEVRVIQGGVGFSTNKTFLNIISAGSNCKLQSTPKKWTINLVQRNVQSNQITDDDGIIYEGINSNYGLEYTHLYSPRKLRQILLSKRLINGQETYVPDLIISNNKESPSSSHSPIIGWAYDGNPIYGPYGYSSETGGTVKALKSGYKISIKSNRPNTSIYPEGFFVEDYVFNSDGDLDKHNGRFCITPEFPNGTYAYFSTINGSSVESSPPFKNFISPSFPYFIGNSFKSDPILFNFDPKSNQDDIDLNETQLFRNTKPYNLLSENSGYDFLLNPNKIKNQNSIINYISKGEVNSVGILTGGKNYKVGDSLIFNNDRTKGSDASAKVLSVKGKKVSEINVTTSSLSDVEIIPDANQNLYYGFSSSSHNLLNGDTVSITGLSTTASSLQGSYSVGVRSDQFILNVGVGTTGTTGIVTYFNVFGNLQYPFIRENDIFQLGNEKVKVLNIDSSLNRIRVLRAQDSTVGSSHTASTLLVEKSRKFSFVSPITSTTFPHKSNKELYFDPTESIGIGTVGIGYTLFFSNPGVGATQLFVPIKSIYLKNHNLETGTKVIYSSNSGSPITVFADGSSFQLTDNQILYVAKISNDLIGVSTNFVGLGSTGGFVGINSSIQTSTLYFTNVGVGVIHSFKTVYNGVITAKVDKNLVTVSTASTHGLSLKDSVSIFCSPGISTTYKVRYNDYNRRLIVNPKDFASGDVNIAEDTITIVNHGYYNGQKVVYTSSSPSGGLFSNSIYYIVKINDNTIKLSNSYYNATLDYPITVDITTTSSGTISLVNPQLSITKNQKVIFDLSHNSLSYIKNSVRVPAFDFNLYSDSNFENIFDSTSSSNNFEISKTGNIGVDTSAKLTLSLNDFIPKSLYYSLSPLEFDEIDLVKSQVIVDDENISNNNLISIVDSSYSGNHKITGLTSTTFSYNILIKPEKSSYISSEADISYTTTSLSTTGEIDSVKITSGGKYYDSLPGINSVFSSSGSNAILFAESNNIGKVSDIIIQDIGFDYSSDLTLRPTAKFPQIIKVNTLSKFKRIGISSIGVNYRFAPNLVVLDGLTNKKLENVELRYNLGDSEVTILKNTTNLNDINPTIIPINNSNSIGINSITFNNITKDVTVGLAVSYSNSSDFPFSVGDKVLIENTSVGIGNSLRGFNSSSYNYELFTIKSIDPNIGGENGSVVYSLSNYLNSGEVPGTFSPVYSSGTIIPQKYFPIFDIELEKNQFLYKEVVSSESSSGLVEGWDPNNQLLKVSSIDDFSINELIIGETSNSQANIESVDIYSTSYNIKSSSIVKNKWNSESGFLNNTFQRLHDNDYYQYFSYSIKSKINYETWNNLVSNLNHTAGFKKFSDLIVESKDETFVGIATNQNNGDFVGVSDLIRIIDVNCINDYDLAFEKSLKIDSNLISDEIVLRTKILQDYFESVGNRVLSIDDFSNQFNSNPRSTPFSIVSTFNLSDGRSKKFFTFVRDRRFISEKQFCIVSLLHDDSTGYINQYGRIETVSNMGSFDFITSGAEGSLVFYPVNYEVNDFDVTSICYNIKDAISGIGTLSLGNVVDIKTSNTLIPSGSTSPISVVGIASTYRTSKILVEIGAIDDSYHEFDELTVLHDGTNIQLLDYGQLTDNIISSYGSSGIGTYSASFSGQNLVINLTPDVGLGVSFVVNSMRISIANTTSTGIASETLNNSQLKSNYVSIASSTSPTQHLISSYTNTNSSSSSSYSSAYFLVCVEDITNNRSQVSEIVVVDDGIEVSIAEFGILYTDSALGNIDATVSSTNTNLYFTPNSGIDVQVRVFQNSLGLIDNTNSLDIIDLNNGSIKTDYGIYRGTFTDIKRQFDLTHKQIPIFSRNFDGSSPNIVNINNNTIEIQNHFFVSGEEISYSYLEDGITQPIGIASTSFAGIGITNKLPSTVYAIKIDNSFIKLASSAENALKTIPLELDLMSVGIGTLHTFTAKNQNSRVLVSIDNVVQSPIVSTAITTLCTSSILVTDDTIKLSGITSIFGGDLLKINSEIVRVNSVGFGSTNSILVERGWLGTIISIHSPNTLVTKVTGNYNIVGNNINFVTAPYGLTPLSTTTNTPNNVDWVGISTRSTFNGRSFIRSGVKNTTSEPYSKNYIFDDISMSFSGIKTGFTLKSNNNDIVGVSTSNAIVLINDVFQSPQRLSGALSISGDYTLNESAGISSIQFTGTATSLTSDINASNLPTGGVIVSVGSTNGFGYQPLISAGGTAVVSTSGTIQSISIGNSGSGYRVGIQTIVNVGVLTSSVGIPNIEFIGTASISGGHIVSVAITNPGTGYTSSNPPIVIFDDPLSYSNIPLTYSSSSVSGVGTEATIDIIVGQDSSIISFDIKNLGYGYGQGEILTIPVAGSTGIPTNTSLSFKEFQIYVERTQSDTFSGWIVGDLQVLDPLDDLFDGTTVSFQLTVNTLPRSIRSKAGSNIDVQSTLLVFINDILQVPGQGYRFPGGSFITFSEPPKSGDTSKIIFYRGTGDVDVVDVDILETIKPGDTIRLDNELTNLKENERLVSTINSIDTLNTIPYAGPGVTSVETLDRPIIWCKQTEDLFINGKEITKNREIYEPYIHPTTRIIQNVGIGSLEIFVESVKTFFDSNKENTTNAIRSKIQIISQDEYVGAAASAVVSVAGTISYISLQSGGKGYTTAPTVSISHPPVISGITSTAVATVQSIPYSEYGSFGMTNYFAGDVDNVFFTISLPFEIDFLGNRYSTVYLGSNGYFTFGGGSNQFNAIRPNLPSLPGVHVIPGNRRLTQIYTLSSGGTFRIRVEGYNYGTSSALTPHVYEILFTNGSSFIDVNLVTITNSVLGGITDGISANYLESFTANSTNSYRIYTSPFSTNYLNYAIANASITSGIVTSIQVTNSGFGYTNTNPPSILIESPPVSGYIEEIEDVSYSGDFGIISGISTVSVGVALTGIVFDLLIPHNSFLRDPSIVGSAITVSGIQTGYYFVVLNSNVGNGVTSLYQNGSVLSIGSSYVDNVYEVASVSIAQTSTVGSGVTYVAKVTVSLSDYNGLSGIGYSNFFGEYSWGRISMPSRNNAKSFTSYNNGLIGVSTSPIIQRVNSLRYLNYN